MTTTLTICPDANAASPSDSSPNTAAKTASLTTQSNGTAATKASTRSLEPGDIIGYCGFALGSAIINLATYGIPFWNLSHVGIVGEHHGRLLIFESCLGSGVQASDLASIDGYHGRVYHYPLTTPLYDFERRRLNGFLEDYLGTPYDEIGAFRSAGVGWSLIESFLRPADLSSIFCSELCAAALTYIGRFHTDHVSRWSPNRLVRVARRQGILGKPIQLQARSPA